MIYISLNFEFLKVPDNINFRTVTCRKSSRFILKNYMMVSLLDILLTWSFEFEPLTLFHLLNIITNFLLLGKYPFATRTNTSAHLYVNTNQWCRGISPNFELSMVLKTVIFRDTQNIDFITFWTIFPKLCS